MNSAPVEGAERIRARGRPKQGADAGAVFEAAASGPPFACARKTIPRTQEGAMKAAVATPAVLLASPALAHPGHVAQSGGHAHWYVLGALALALVIAGAALWRGRRAKAARDAAERRA